MALVKCPECSKDVSDEAESCPSCGHPLRASVHEPEFRAFRRRVLVGALIVCIAGLAVGICLKLPYVWGLGILGTIVAGVRLATLRR